MLFVLQRIDENKPIPPLLVLVLALAPTEVDDDDVRGLLLLLLVAVAALLRIDCKRSPGYVL